MFSHFFDMKNYSDYMILLSPSVSVKAQVRQHKSYVANVIGNYESMNSIAHITINNELVRQKSFLTEPIIRLMRPMLATTPPIILTIQGFDYFNQGNDYKTIYASLKSTPETVAWFKKVKKAVKMKRYFVPHITIARNITMSEFNTLWPHFKSLKWDESFTVNELLVLEKETFAPFAKWEEFTRLPFKGKSIAVELPKPSLVKPLRSAPGQGVQISLF